MKIFRIGARVTPFLVWFASSSAVAGVPLADSADGVTCYNYAIGMKLPWQKKGGDWIDAADKAFGEKPYASARLAVRQGRQQLSIDVTTLVRSWSDGVEPRGGVFLRMVPGSKSGLADFASRENADASAHPLLTIGWSDGHSSTIRPIADTYLDCSTVNSLGSRPMFQTGHGLSAILSFPFEARPKAAIKSATLVLTSDKQYGGNTSTLGVYRPLLPWTQDIVRENGIASAFPLDQGIENHPEVIFAEQFESRRWLDSWSDFDRTGHAEAVSKDDANRFEPLAGNALQVTIKKGSTQGLNMHYRFGQSGRTEPEEVFFRYYLRLGESWDPTLEGGKMPGLSGSYGRAGWGGRKSDGKNGWAARGSFYTVPREPSLLSRFRGIGSYLYHADMDGSYGAILGWGRGPSGALEKNRWYSVEQQVRMNRPGEKDGILRAWIDGQLVFEKTNLRFRDIPKLRIESVWMNVYHGGTRPAHKDLTLFIDNVVVAKKYIGPAGTPASERSGTAGRVLVKHHIR